MILLRRTQRKPSMFYAGHYIDLGQASEVTEVRIVSGNRIARHDFREECTNFQRDRCTRHSSC
jgi:hypothetical protein